MGFLRKIITIETETAMSAAITARADVSGIDCVGFGVGFVDCIGLTCCVGCAVGLLVGLIVGLSVGLGVGVAIGVGVGVVVGMAVGVGVTVGG